MVETNSVSTLVAHARSGLPGITAHTWLDANPLPADLRAIPLVAPAIEHTIGLVTSTAIDRTPVIAELLDLLCRRAADRRPSGRDGSVAGSRQSPEVAVSDPNWSSARPGTSAASRIAAGPRPPAWTRVAAFAPGVSPRMSTPRVRSAV